MDFTQWTLIAEQEAAAWLHERADDHPCRTVWARRATALDAFSRISRPTLDFDGCRSNLRGSNFGAPRAVSFEPVAPTTQHALIPRLRA